jgi:hypothetical protein
VILCNAAMGIICATPTAGSSGTIPGVIFKLEKTHNITEDQMIVTPGIVPEEPAVGVAQIIPIAALTSFVATAPLTASIIS